MKPKESAKFWYHLTDEGRGYCIQRRDTGEHMESGIMRNKTAAEKEAKKRIRYFEQKEAA